MNFFKRKKKYTEDEVTQVIRDVLKGSVDGLLKWLEKETVIVDKTTGIEILNSKIELAENSRKPTEYIYPELRKIGVNFTPSEQD